MQHLASSLNPLFPSRSWWAALLVIVVLSAIPRYTGYNFSLPYLDHADEADHNVAAQMIIDHGTSKPMRLHGYPPGIVTLNYLLLRWFHEPGTPSSTVTPTLRLISITTNLGTLVVIALMGYRVATPPGGLLGGALWGVSPVVVEFSRYATADNYITFFMALSIFLAITGALYDRDRWTTWSVVALMLAIAFKYQAALVTPIVMLAPLWRLRTAAKSERRRIARNFAVNVALFGGFALWLVGLYPALEATQAPNWAAPPERFGLLSAAALAENFRVGGGEALGSPLLWLLALPGLVLLFLPALRTGAWAFGMGIVALCALAYFFGVSLYGAQEFRQLIPEAALLSAILGSALGGWAAALAWGLERFAPSLARSRRAWLGAGIVALVVALSVLPQARSTLADAREHTLPDHRNELARWMDITLAPAPHIANQNNQKTLDPVWGGYAGRNSFPLVEVARLSERPIDEWRAMGVVYAIQSYDFYRELEETPEGRDLRAQLLLLKSYPPSGNYRGPSMVVVRLYPMQYEAEGILGPIHLVGYDLDRAEVVPGQTVTFTMYWQSFGATDADYTVYNHLVPPDSRSVLAQVDGQPMPDERRPTSTWGDDAETLVSRSFSLRIPANLMPGDYRLITGFYRADTGERLLAPNGDDFLTLATITVQRAY